MERIRGTINRAARDDRRVVRWALRKLFEMVEMGRREPALLASLAGKMQDSTKRSIAFMTAAWYADREVHYRRWIERALEAAGKEKDSYCRVRTAVFTIYVMARKGDPELKDVVDGHLRDLRTEPSRVTQAYGLEMLLKAVYPSGEVMVDRILPHFKSVCRGMHALCRKRNWLLRKVALMLASTWPEKGREVADLIDRPISRENCLRALADGKCRRPRRFIEDFIRQS